MKAFYRIKRDGFELWIEMFTDNRWPYYAARKPIQNRKEGLKAFRHFVEELRNV